LELEIDGEQIQYLGEVSHEQKVQLLSGATVTLFPITWREPFGLVMIESMAPVIGRMGLVRTRNHRPWENWFCLRLSGKND